MKSKTILLALLTLAGLLLGATACDSPSDPSGPFAVTFDCTESPSGTLRCTTTLTGGRKPIVYFWTPDFIDAQVLVDVGSATFAYDQLCDERDDKSKKLAVTVKLKVVGKDGNGQELGPITKPFRVCDT